MVPWQHLFFRTSTNCLVEADTDISDGGIKLEASMCHLRGKIYSHLNNFDRAKECYQEALMVDAKCFDALDDLLNNNLMTSDEGGSFTHTPKIMY